MKAGFFSSIRFRAYLLYVGVLALALLFHNALMFHSFRDSLRRQVDEVLAAKASAAESAVVTFRAAQTSVRTAAPPAPETRSWFSNLFGGNPANTNPRHLFTDDPYETVFRYLTRDTLSPSDADTRIAIDVYRLDGNLLESSMPNERISSLPPVVLARVLAGEKAYYNMKIKSEKAPVAMRALATVVRDDGRPRDIVQVRVPTGNIDRQIRWFLLQLALRTLFVLAMASGGSFILVKFTLRPVDRMTRTIRNIKPENLDQRLREPDTHDEIDRLAETFNEMLARLEKSFKSQKQIVQDISHELKTPLTIIRGQMEVALKKKRSVDEYEEILQSGLEEIQKVRQIVDNLLLLAKFDNPGHSIDMKTINLNGLLEGLVQDTQILCLERQISVSLSAAKPITVRGNEVHLDRLFRNLLENAAKYNVPGGSIEVTLDEDRDNAWVTIKDTGIGIADPEIEKVFDRFYRVDQARSSREGFGLGLSISKSIIDAHNGKIQVQSTVGRGTTFRVALPLRASALAYV